MARQHSLLGCYLIVGTTRIEEFGESDACRIRPNADVAEMVVGADGKPIFNAINDDNLIAEVTVSQTSYAYRVISNMISLQKASALLGQLPVAPFSWSNFATGDVVFAAQAVFLNAAEVLGNKTAGEVTFRIALPSPKVTRGTLITPLVGA